MTKRATTIRTSVKKQGQEEAEVSVTSQAKSMYVVTEHWKSDMEFFHDEMNFMRTLIDKYLLSVIDEKHIDGTRNLARDFTQFDKKRDELESEVTSHLTRLADLIQNPFAHDCQVLRDAHGELEVSMADFVKKFRSLKKEVFALAEHAMESEKAKHLLGS